MKPVFLAVAFIITSLISPFNHAEAYDGPKFSSGEEYIIMNVGSGQVLDYFLSGENKIGLWDYSGQDNQRFFLEEYSTGQEGYRFKIRSKATGQYLTGLESDHSKYSTGNSAAQLDLYNAGSDSYFITDFVSQQGSELPPLDPKGYDNRMLQPSGRNGLLRSDYYKDFKDPSNLWKIIRVTKYSYKRNAVDPDNSEIGTSRAVHEGAQVVGSIGKTYLLPASSNNILKLNKIFAPENGIYTVAVDYVPYRKASQPSNQLVLHVNDDPNYQIAFYRFGGVWSGWGSPGTEKFTVKLQAGFNTIWFDDGNAYHSSVNIKSVTVTQ